ncbi:MAG: hypothetical protein IJS48_08310 [Prevotella sp.]|nr:hypothetical protein [Prevotella sp.]
MIKRQLIVKTLLVAVGLLVGGNSAWADAEIPVYNSSTGFYVLNEVSYVKKTYNFGDYTFANSSSDTSFPVGFTGSDVTRYKNTISKDGTKAIAGSPIEITFRSMESKESKNDAYYYFYAGIGMQVNNQVTIYLAGSNASTIAVLNYKVGAASDKPTVAGATPQTEVQTGLLPSFALKDKETYYYLYESVDVYNPVSTETIDGIAPAADGYYYKDGARYTRTTYDFRHYTRYGSYSSGSPAGFSVATSTNRYQVQYNSDKTDIPTGLTYGRTDEKDAFVVFCDTYGMQANGNSTLSVTTKDCNTMAYLFHKVGNKSEVVTEASAPEVFERAAGESLPFTLNNKNGVEPWLYTRMEVFQKVSECAKIGAMGYTTFASSSPLDCSDLPSGLNAYYVVSSNIEKANSIVKLTSVTEAVAAGTGLILKGTAGESYNIPVTTSGTDLSATNKMIGCITATDITSSTENYDNFYVLVNGSTEPEFQNLKNYLDNNDKVTIPAGKAYLNATGVDAARLSIIFDDDETTGVHNLDANDDLNNEVYDLQGRRVVQPQKGLYIVNGKKIVIK